MQIVVFLTATCSGAERKFNDAFVFGVFYGHPSKIRGCLKTNVNEK